MVCVAENADESTCNGVADYCSKSSAIGIGTGVGGVLNNKAARNGIAFIGSNYGK